MRALVSVLFVAVTVIVIMAVLVIVSRLALVGTPAVVTMPFVAVIVGIGFVGVGMAIVWQSPKPADFAACRVRRLVLITVVGSSHHLDVGNTLRRIR